ncbi:UNVERIFIED_CONTAM: hypothetical protein K2H54_008273 [Gekko kuhli]
MTPPNDEEEDEVEQKLEMLERAQEKFHQDLEEVIRAIPEMVVRALKAGMASRETSNRNPRTCQTSRGICPWGQVQTEGCPDLILNLPCHNGRKT